jgi:hypothetical protein
VDVGPPIVAHRKPPVAGQPRQRALHHPTVTAELLARLFAPPGDAPLDAAPSERSPAPGEVVALVGVQLLGTLPRSARGLPAGRLIGSMSSSNSSKTFESWTLAAVSATASGTPFRSETRWRFEPGLPRSVGFLLTFSPPFWPPPTLAESSEVRLERARRGTRVAGERLPTQIG